MSQVASLRADDGPLVFSMAFLNISGMNARMNSPAPGSRVLAWLIFRPEAVIFSTRSRRSWS